MHELYSIPEEVDALLHQHENAVDAAEPATWRRCSTANDMDQTPRCEKRRAASGNAIISAAAARNAQLPRRTYGVAPW